jgi:hypothetical protein
MNEPERAFDERDIATEGYQRLASRCLYNTQLGVTLWSNWFRLAHSLGFCKNWTRKGQLELENSRSYWTGD